MRKRSGKARAKKRTSRTFDPIDTLRAEGDRSHYAVHIPRSDDPARLRGMWHPFKGRTLSGRSLVWGLAVATAAVLLLTFLLAIISYFIAILV
jgi:hypothetical protein